MPITCVNVQGFFTVPIINFSYSQCELGDDIMNISGVKEFTQDGIIEGIFRNFWWKSDLQLSSNSKFKS